MIIKKTTTIIIASGLFLLLVIIGLPLFLKRTHYSGHKSITVQIADANKYEGCDVSYATIPISELLTTTMNNERILSSNLKKVKLSNNNFQAKINTEGYISWFNLIKSYRNDTDIIVAIDCPNSPRTVKSTHLPNLKDKDNEIISVK